MDPPSGLIRQDAKLKENKALSVDWWDYTNFTRQLS